MKFKVVRKGYLEKMRKEKNEYWLNEWIKKKRGKRQKGFINYLQNIIPKEKWNERLIRRFVIKIDVKTNDECWNWMFGLLSGNRGGYGMFFTGTKANPKIELSHRLMWSLLNGEIPEDKKVLHSCDNRKCVNPNHLYLGTDEDNAKDRESRNRGRHPRGEAHGRAELDWKTVNNVRETWKKCKCSQDTLCEIYGIPKHQIRRIVKNKQWYSEEYGKWLDSNCRLAGILELKDVNRVRELWKKKTRRYSQAKIAKMFGVSKATVGCIVRNERWFDAEYQKWLDET